jgi:hypothetical protein
MRQDFDHIARTYGIHLGSLAMDYLPEEFRHEAELAMDALPALVTTTNSGIPAFLTNYVDPKFIEVMTTANKAALILGEEKKGDWTTKTAFFPVIESAGEVSSYGDYANNGEITANVNWPQRQSYTYQIITQWGMQELEQMGKGKIDWANRLNIAGARVMDKFQNKSYFFGLTGLQNYGLLNDPNLIAPITPLTKAAGGVLWLNATALEIYADILAEYQQLVFQSGGLIEMDFKGKLCMSPTISVNLGKLTPFNVSVRQMLKDNFPNMTIETAVEYATASGQLVQMIADNVGGEDVAHCAFTEKMRAGPVIPDLSSWAQKKAGGTWGAIITYSSGIAQLLGV